MNNSQQIPKTRTGEIRSADNTIRKKHQLTLEPTHQIIRTNDINHTSHSIPKTATLTPTVNLNKTSTKTRQTFNFKVRKALRLATINIEGGIKEKFQDICTIFESKKIDILVLTETHTNELHLSQLKNAFRKAVIWGTNENTRKWGCWCLIRKELKPFIRNVQELVKGRVLEISLDKIWSKPVQIIASYSPATNNWKEKGPFWDGIWNRIQNNKEETILIGDINVPLDNENSPSHSFNNIRNTLVDILALHGKEDHTFYRGDSKSRIDGILATEFLASKTFKPKTHTLNALLSPTHVLIQTSIQIKDKQLHHTSSKRVTINTAKINEKTALKFRQVLNIEDKHKEKPLEYYSEVMEHITNQAIEAFGERTISSNHTENTPKELRDLAKAAKTLNKARRALDNWTPLYIPEQILKTTELKGKWEVTLNTREVMSQEIKDKAKTANKTLRKRKKKYNSRRIKKLVEDINSAHVKNPRDFFKRVNNKRSINTGIEAVQTITKEIHTDPETVLSQTKDFFADLFNTNLTLNKEEKPWFDNNTTRLKAIKVGRASDNLMTRMTEAEIEKTMNKLSNRSAPGPDGISYAVLKAGGVFITQWLTKLFNQVLLTQTIPPEWKKCSVFPIFKKGDPTDLNNYRPIALLNCTYKIFTNLMAQRLQKLLDETKLINENQNGFIKGRQIHQKIFILTEIYRHAKEHNKKLWALFLDFHKAYDSVLHHDLSDTLNFYNFNANFRTLITNILEGAEMQIITNYGLTDPFIVKKGVRQGCPLSPLLFVIYINPLLDYLDVDNLGYKIGNTTISSNAFADDIAALTENFEDMKKQFQKIRTFTKVYNLKLNLDSGTTGIRTKTVLQTRTNSIGFLYLTPGDTSTRIPQISSRESYKYLGIPINMDLDYSTLTQDTKSKVVAILQNIRYKSFTPHQLTIVYNKVILPFILYRAAIIKLPNTWINWITRYITFVIYGKMHLPSFNSIHHLTAPPSEGGLGLADIELEQATTILKTFTRDILNGKDTKAKTIAEENLQQQNLSTGMKETLSFFKAEINHNKEPTFLFTQSDWSNQPEPLVKWILENNPPTKQERLNIFTDASTTANITGIGIWSNEITLSRSLPTNLPQNNFTGELLAIVLTALATSRRYRESHIFSDARSAIDLLKEHSIKEPEPRDTFYGILVLWKHALRIATQEGSEIYLHHIYSHLDKRHWSIRQRMEEIYGEDLIWIAKGNEEADAAAKRAVREYTLKFPAKKICTTSITIENTTTQNINESLNNWKQLLLDTRIQRKKGSNRQQGTRSNIQLGNSKKDAQLATFAFKIYTDKLLTKSRILDNPTILKDIIHNAKNPERTKNAYQDDKCPSCHASKEDLAHFIACSLTNNNLAKKIRKRINKELPLDRKLDKIPIFFPSPKTNPSNLNTQEQILANNDPLNIVKGIIPTGISPWLTETGVEKENIPATITDIMGITLDHFKNKWNLRCNKLYPPTHPH